MCVLGVDGRKASICWKAGWINWGKFGNAGVLDIVDSIEELFFNERT